jgi:hypothetical protein
MATLVVPLIAGAFATRLPAVATMEKQEMKSLFLATAAVAALAAAPALAQDAVGSVGATYSNSEADLGGVGAETEAYTLDGSVALPVGAWTVTFAGSGADSDADTVTVGGTAHLTTVVGGDLRVGGFVGLADVADEGVWTAGAEAQKYLGRATLTGVVAYSTADDIDVDAWTVGADAAFYVMPTLRVNAGLGYTTFDAAGVDVDGVSYNAGAEYQIARTPFSVTAGYSHADIEDLDVDTWSLGLRYTFGGGLQARDRAGAALPGSSVMGILGAL